MTYRLPPLNWLRAFEAAARQGSFTAAAVELNLTQAAISHQVRSLEAHLGILLFKRLARSLALTDAGRAYLPSIRKAFDELSLSTLGLFGPVSAQTLNLRVPVSLAVLWLAPRLGRFLAAYPDVGIRLFSVIWADALPDDQTDIDIRFGDGRWPGLDVELLRNDPAVPVMSPQLLRRGRRPRGIGDLPPFGLIHIMGLEDAWPRLFRAQNRPPPAPADSVTVDTSLAALELAAAGTGVAMVQTCFLRPYLDSRRLILPLDLELPLEQSHFLVMPRGRTGLRPEALLLREWLLDETRGDRAVRRRLRAVKR